MPAARTVAQCNEEPAGIGKPSAMRPDAKWFPFWHPVAGARARLLCLPCAGAGASMFQRWRRLLPDVEILAAQLPGREQRLREAPLRDLGPLVDGLADALATLPQPAATPLPLAVLGHSMGALVGFALCRALRGQSSPSRLFVAGARAPHRPPRRPLHALPLPELLDELVAMGGLSPQARAEPLLIELIEPALRADLHLAEAHVLPAAPPLSIPIHVFGGRDDGRVLVAELEAWRDATTVHCTIDILPGGHFFVVERAADVAQRVGALLP